MLFFPALLPHTCFPLQYLFVSVFSTDMLQIQNQNYALVKSLDFSRKEVKGWKREWQETGRTDQYYQIKGKSAFIISGSLQAFKVCGV